MTFVQWNNSLATGHEIIDKQHKTLVYMLNTLHKAMSEGVAQDRLLRIFSQFFRYLVFHFNEEESCTVSVDFHMWQANRREHKEFIASLTSIMNRIYFGEMSIGLTTLQLVSDLYIEHISMSDKSIIACMNRPSAPEHRQLQETL